MPIFIFICPLLNYESGYSLQRFCVAVIHKFVTQDAAILNLYGHLYP